MAPLPAFAAIRPEHVTPALDHLLAEADSGAGTRWAPRRAGRLRRHVAVLDVPVERLRAPGAIGHLQPVADTPELRAAYAENLPRVTDFTPAWAPTSACTPSTGRGREPAAARLSPARRQALAHALRDFVLGGAELQGGQANASPPSRTAGASLVAAVPTTCWMPPTPSPGRAAEDLAGVPADVVQAARARVPPRRRGRPASSRCSSPCYGR
jgi:oligopeptidase A